MENLMDVLFPTEEQILHKAHKERAERELLARVNRLVARFDSAIKFYPMPAARERSPDRFLLVEQNTTLALRVADDVAIGINGVRSTFRPG
jgi:hypothetical protein